MSKKSFVLHHDSLSILDELNNEQAGLLFKAIYNYNIGNDFELPTDLRLLFISFKNQFVRDKERYLDKVEINKLNGSKGGLAKSTKIKQTLPNATKRKRSVANLADSDNDSDSDNVNKKENNNSTTLVLPFNSDKFVDVWNILIEEPKWKKKSLKAYQMNLDILKAYPEEQAIKMMEKAIRDNWQGLYPINDSKPEAPKLPERKKDSNLDVTIFEDYEAYCAACDAENTKPVYEEYFDRVRYDARRK